MISPTILSIQYGGHDTSAALMMGGRLIAACEQERYNREKHTREFPSDAVMDCLRIGGIRIGDITEIALCNDSAYYIRETYLKPALEDVHRIDFLIRDIDRIRCFHNIEQAVRERTGFCGPIVSHQHHLCHLASAYYPSGFDEALLVSFDGVGEIETGLIGAGRHGAIDVLDSSNRYPHSLGLLYSAVTHFLGFLHHCDEGIVMGLAAYGDPTERIPGRGRTYESVFGEIVQEAGHYRFTLDMTWMAYYHVRDKWISDKFTNMFGPGRKRTEPLTRHHENIAAALQQRLESVVLNQLRRARHEFGFSRLALAGGVALNCSMNGKIAASGLFDEIFLQPASGDSGTAVGACFLSHQRVAGPMRPSRAHDVYLGSGFSDEEVVQALEARGVRFTKCADICKATAERLARGKIVAWFQGRTEFGPRALGNRSILARPFPAAMKDHLNDRVKHRESFRPFAPAVLSHHAAAFFQLSQESPHMLIACATVGSRRADIAATVHVDGSCRVQTVRRENNPRFYDLIEAFYAETGCPVVLNTSFNVRGEPIVNSPLQAVDCYNNTDIDVLAIGDFLSEKPAA
jgi:carbamoyltransferase